jgi:hypothetical protein
VLLADADGMDVSRCIAAGITAAVMTIAITAGMWTVFVAGAVDQVPSSQLWIRLDVADQLPEGPDRRCRDLRCGWRGTKIVPRTVRDELFNFSLNQRADSRQRKKSRQVAQLKMFAARKATETSKTRGPTHRSLMVKFRSEVIRGSFAVCFPSRAWPVMPLLFVGRQPARPQEARQPALHNFYHPGCRKVGSRLLRP